MATLDAREQDYMKLLAADAVRLSLYHHHHHHHHHLKICLVVSRSRVRATISRSRIRDFATSPHEIIQHHIQTHLHSHNTHLTSSTTTTTHTQNSNQNSTTTAHRYQELGQENEPVHLQKKKGWYSHHSSRSVHGKIELGSKNHRRGGERI